MNKAVMISIKPQWCELIANGSKTIEVRKSKPKLETPFKVYIYQSTETRLTTAYKKGETTGYKDDDGNDILFDEFVPVRKLTFNQRKVIGEYVCDSIDTLLVSDTRKKWKEAAKASCLTFQQMDEYSGIDEKTLYLWHISNLVIYDKPKELSEFKKINRDCWYADLGLTKRDCPECDNKACFIQRAPQSWCYVEEVKICQ